MPTTNPTDVLVSRLKAADAALTAYPALMDARHDADAYNALMNAFMDAQNAVIMAALND